MPLPQKRLIPGILLMLALVALAAPPIWWSAGDPPVITTGAPVNNQGPANIGQAKHMAWSALQTIRSLDPEMASEIESRLIGTGNPLADWAARKESDYSPLLVGQLKAISAPFYESIHSGAGTWLKAERVNNQTEFGGIYPWTSTVVDDQNKGIANIGQLKAVFSLRFTESLDSDPGSDYLEYRFLGTLSYHFDPNGDADNDGISNLEELQAVSIAENRDTDGDGLSDGYEMMQAGLDPFKKDTDGDGISDGQTDVDHDGISDQWEEALVSRVPHDSSITDVHGILPNDDFDGDGLSNRKEYLAGYSGYEADTDGDGYRDLLSYSELIHLDLNEESGVIAVDRGSRQYNGTLLSSPTWMVTEGIHGGGIEFNSTGDGIAVPKNILDGKSDLSMSLWFKTTDTSPQQTLLSGWGSGTSPEYGIILENGNTVRFIYRAGSSVSWNVGKKLTDGFWHQVVLVRDVRGSVTLYLDGRQAGLSQSVSISPLAVTAVTLGQYHLTTSTFDDSKEFSGKIDEFRVCSVPLDASYSYDLFQLNDRDQDGLPDEWENFFFGSLAPLVATGDDLDGDGLTNREEFDGSTDPKDYFNGISPVVTLVSGSGQSVYKGQRTANPLVFLVSTDGTPLNKLVNVPVELRHLERIGDIQLLDGSASTTDLSLKTDAEGKVSVHFKAN